MTTRLFFALLAVALSVVPGTVRAFAIPQHQRGSVGCSALRMTIDDNTESKFERAVECAEHFGRCKVDELVELADELESKNGCFYEDDDALACTQELMDRLEVAKTLRLQAQLLDAQGDLRQRNLFASDVHKEHDMRDREALLETMQQFGTD